MYKFIPDCQEESKFVQSTSWFQSGKKTNKIKILFDCVQILRVHLLSSDLDFRSTLCLRNVYTSTILCTAILSVD